MTCPRCITGCLTSDVNVDGWQDKCIICSWRGPWHAYPRPTVERPVVKGEDEAVLTPERKKRRAYEAERVARCLCVDCNNQAHVGKDGQPRRRCLACLLKARQRVKVARE